MAAPHLNPFSLLGGDLSGTLPNPRLREDAARSIAERMFASRTAVTVPGVPGVTLTVGIPQNVQAGNYTITASDNGRGIDHLSGAGSGDTYTIPANSSVALEIGFTFTVCNLDSNAVTLAITSDTLYFLPSGSTGSRTIAQYGMVTCRKVDSTKWVCVGVGVT